MIRILLADDHRIITEGISNLLESQTDMCIIGICQNGLEVLHELKKKDIDLVLMDIEMPQMDGLTCAETILEKYPDQKIAMLTMYREKSMIKQLISLGVKGYFLKTIEKQELILGIKMIADGGEYFPADVTKTLIGEEKDLKLPPQHNLIAQLSPREIEIIRLVAQGFSNKEIADKLFISHRTVDTHRTNLMKKLDIHNIAGLVRFAFVNRLVD